MVAQPRLTLPPMAAVGLARGHTELRLSTLRGSDFGWSQNETGETPQVRNFLVDGETQTSALRLRHGLGDGVTLGARLSLGWRGAGVFDALIDDFHRLGGFADNLRKDFVTNRFRASFTPGGGTPIQWAPGSGWLGTELSVQWELARDARSAHSVVVRADLPTGSGPFARRGVDWGVQWSGALTLHNRLRLHGGGGATFASRTRHAGIRYAQWRGHGFVGAEFRLAPRLHATLTTTIASRLLHGIPHYPSLAWMAHVGLTYRAGPRAFVEALLVENLEDQQGTTDVALMIALRNRF